MKLSCPVNSKLIKTLTFCSFRYQKIPASSFRRFSTLNSPAMAPLDPPEISTRTHHEDTDFIRRQRKKRLVVVMGATGAGKSKLSIDLATRYFPSSEIINCDKIQLYKGLNITTNKMPVEERRGVVHHLLGEFETELSAADYRSVASELISDIVQRRKVPLLVGRSNSFIHALLADHYDPESDPFTDSGAVFPELRYSCCFLWVDVAIPVLNQYLDRRVDEMMESGMFEELEAYFDSEKSTLSAAGTGINKAIGVLKFEPYIRKYPRRVEEEDGDVARERIQCYATAVNAVKDNTCQLAKRQIGKILRLREGGREMTRLDATAAFQAVLAEEVAAGKVAWEKDVVEPSVKVVKHFLAEDDDE